MCHQPKSYCNAMCRHSLRQRFESFTLRLFALLLPRTFGAAATVPVSSLPTDGKPDKRNWHLRSLKDRQFHSPPAMSGVDNDGPVHAGLHRANAEMLCRVRPSGVVMSGCSDGVLWPSPVFQDAGRRRGVSESPFACSMNVFCASC